MNIFVGVKCKIYSNFGLLMEFEEKRCLQTIGNCSLDDGLLNVQCLSAISITTNFTISGTRTYAIFLMLQYYLYEIREDRFKQKRILLE